jgi:hypothetical protein
VIIPEVAPSRAVRALTRVDHLTHNIAHHNLLRLAKTQGACVLVDLHDLEKSFLQSYFHISKGEMHIFAASNVGVLIGVGPASSIRLLPVVLSFMDLQLEGGELVNFSVAVSAEGDADKRRLEAECNIAHASFEITDTSWDQSFTGNILDILFEDAQTWRESIDAWQASYPDFCPPALLAPAQPQPDHPDIAKAQGILQDTLDALMLCAGRPDNIASITAILTLAGPRQDGAGTQNSHTWITNLTTTSMHPPHGRFRYVADLADKILDHRALREMKSLTDLVPAWDPRASLVPSGWPWETLLRLKSAEDISAHRRLWLSTKYQDFITF